jgi:hypothetical protein
MPEVEVDTTIHRLIIDATIFNSNDVNVIFNWLMEVRGFKQSLRLEQLSVWFAYRSEVVYDSYDIERIEAFCEALDALDMNYERKIIDNGV